MVAADTAAVDANIRRLGRNENIFDFLRLIAASAVVIQHANHEFGTNFAWGIFEFVEGVPMFFIMSGMLVYLSAEKIYETTGKWRQYFWNRYLRIAPGLYLFAILTPLILLAVGAVTAVSIFNLDLVKWLGSFLVLVPGYDMPAWSGVGAGAVTWPLYTIPAEVSFYLITPLLVIVAKRFGFWWMLSPFLAVSVLGGIAYYVAVTQGVGALSSVLNHTFLHQGACFAAGVFWARYWGRLPVKWWIPILALVAYVALKLFGGGLLSSVGPLLIAIPLSILVMYAGYFGPKILAGWAKTVGDFSFATYIWHYLIINILLWWGLGGSWWSTLLALAITWAIAAGSWWGIERSALKLKRISLRSLTTATGT